MRRKNKIAQPLVAAIGDKPLLPGAVLAERILIGALTALIVARALIAGDDPGRLRLTSGGGPLTLNIATFLLLMGWAVWRAWTKQSLVRGPAAIVVFGLLCVAGLVFVSAAGADRYQRPGWFIAWDWVSIATLCFLTWQLSSTTAIASGLTTVLIATGACLTAQALYQGVAFEFGLPSSEFPPSPATSIPLVGDDEFGLNLDQPPPPNGRFRATFDRADTFAGYLLLILPATLLWLMVGWRGGRRGRLLAIIAVPLILAWAIAMASFLSGTSPDLLGRSLWPLIGDHAAFGVGPGNESRYIGGDTRSINSLVNFAASIGLIALVAILITSLLALALGWRGARTVSEAPDEVPLPKRTRWEFYHGGIAGLLLGLILATGDLPAEASDYELLRLGVVSGIRSLVWFFAFSLLENIPVRANLLMRSLLLGAAGVGLLALLSNSLSTPALAQPFWIAITLALSVSNVTRTQPVPSLPLRWAGVPIAIALLVANLVHVALPGFATSSAIRAARHASIHFAVLHWNTEGKTEADRAVAIRKANDYLYSYMLRPLREAADRDSSNSALMLEMARWGRWHWRYLINRKELQAAKQNALEMLALGEKAAKIDSRNLGAKLSVYESLLLFTGESTTATSAQISSLEKYIGQIAEREPQREVGLRYRVALALLQGKNFEALDAWVGQLLRLDGEGGTPHGKLANDQWNRLADGLKRIVGQVALRDPKREVGIRALAALAMIESGNVAELDAWTVALLYRDRVEGSPHGRLSDEQWEYLIESLQRALKAPSPALNSLVTNDPRFRR